MHEIGLIQNLIEQAQQAAAGRVVRQVEVALGELSDISAEALNFYFDQLRRETALAQAKLVIHPEAGRGECRHCGSVGLGAVLQGLCPVCGAQAWKIQRGDTVRLEAIEVE